MTVGGVLACVGLACGAVGWSQLKRRPLVAVGLFGLGVWLCGAALVVIEVQS